MRIIFLMLLASLPMRAEDWTTSDGKSYHDIKVVRVEADAVTILDSDGGARISLAILSPELQQKFHYDPAKAALSAKQYEADHAFAEQQIAFERQQQEKIDKDAQAKALSEAQAEQARLAQDQAHKSHLASIKISQVHLVGLILQKLSDGYLVTPAPPDLEAPGEPVGIHHGPNGSWVSSQTDSSRIPWLRASKIFLINATRDLVDGDQINLLVYPVGEFSYTDTQGAVSTVRKYDLVPAEANIPIEPADQFNPGSLKDVVISSHL